MPEIEDLENELSQVREVALIAESRSDSNKNMIDSIINCTKICNDMKSLKECIQNAG